MRNGLSTFRYCYYCFLSYCTNVYLRVRVCCIGICTKNDLMAAKESQHHQQKQEHASVVPGVDGVIQFVVYRGSDRAKLRRFNTRTVYSCVCYLGKQSISILQPPNEDLNLLRKREKKCATFCLSKNNILIKFLFQLNEIESWSSGRKSFFSMTRRARERSLSSSILFSFKRKTAASSEMANRIIRAVYKCAHVCIYELVTALGWSGYRKTLQAKSWEPETFRFSRGLCARSLPRDKQGRQRARKKLSIPYLLTISEAWL